MQHVQQSEPGRAILVQIEQDSGAYAGQALLLNERSASDAVEQTSFRDDDYADGTSSHDSSFIDVFASASSTMIRSSIQCSMLCS